MSVTCYVTQQFHVSWWYLLIGAENPLLGSTVLYSSKTIEEKPLIAFLTDLLASEQLSAVHVSINVRHKHYIDHDHWNVHPACWLSWMCLVFTSQSSSLDKSFLMILPLSDLTTPNWKLLSWKSPHAFRIPVQWTPPHVLGIPVDVAPPPLRNSEMPPVVWVWIFSGTTQYINCQRGWMTKRWPAHPKNATEATLESQSLWSFNALSPNSCKHLISPYNIPTCSNIQVTKIKEMITKHEMPWCFTCKFFQPVP